jgi:hypothetical protein
VEKRVFWTLGKRNRPLLPAARKFKEETPKKGKPS